MRRITTAVLGLLAGWSASAGIITEVGNAGDMPATAQVTTGADALTAITGQLSGYSDADMFGIYISDPFAFSASTDGLGNAAFDTQLFLFDADGYGVCANDDLRNDRGGYNPHAILIAGSPLNPTAPGLYYLAISGWDRDPHSSGGAIFTDDAYYTGTVGPNGPGGRLAISGWDGRGDMNGGVGAYAIALTGAQFVPEPGGAAAAFVLCGLGLATFRPGARRAEGGRAARLRTAGVTRDRAGT